MTTEDAFVVNGGKPLKGEVQLSGAKNVALKVLIAGLLYNHPMTFHNIPRLKDIDELIHLINHLGAKAEFTETNTIVIDSNGLKDHTVDLLHGSRIRVSFMFFAPLLHKFGKAHIPNPGGCRLGARPINRHINLLKAFGVKVDYDSETGYYNARLINNQLKGSSYTFNKPSHTGTELAVMLAAFAEGKSHIKNAAQEPEIDDLIKLLNESGISITRSGKDIYSIGTKNIQHKNQEFTIMCDRLNAAAYGVFAIATKGDIYVNGLTEDYIEDFVESLKEAGGGFEAQGNRLHFYYKGPLKSTHITTVPHPGFNTDTQGPWAILMTQAEGESTIHETVFENRFGYVSELRKLGAHIDFFEPEVDNPEEVYQFDLEKNGYEDNLQGIKITGPTKLHNAVLNATDIRAGASLIIAACVAEGESVINGASIIDRGYENIEKKLQKLGANIKRI